MISLTIMFILVAVNNKTLQKTVLNGKMLGYFCCKISKDLDNLFNINYGYVGRFNHTNKGLTIFLLISV